MDFSINSFYIPSDISTDYKYLVPHDGYYDLYNTSFLQAGRTYTYYRFYDCLHNQDLYTINSFTQSPYNDSYINTIVVTPSNSLYLRSDFSSIVQTSFIIILFIIFLFNIVSSIIRKGGLLGGLL